MKQSDVLNEIKNYVFALFEKDESGHDYYHMKRVALMATKLAEKEGANPFLVEIAAWLHDVGDKKLFEDPKQVLAERDQLLKRFNLSDDECELISLAISEVSYSKGHTIPSTIEGQVLQDADRLDAIGAIGIARTFAYGGSRQRLMYSEDPNNQTHSVQHFYDKILLLKDLLNTNAAKEIANKRHLFMEGFLEQFYAEWNGEE